jgi:hypothetical protein
LRAVDKDDGTAATPPYRLVHRMAEFHTSLTIFVSVVVAIVGVLAVGVLVVFVNGDARAGHDRVFEQREHVFEVESAL